MEAKTLEIGFVGAGKVGSALAILLQRAGYRIAGVASRTGESANKLATRLNCPVLSKEDVAKRSEVLFITTSDDAIASVAQEIAEKDGFRSEQIVLHMSGAHTAQLLACSRKGGDQHISSPYSILCQCRASHYTYPRNLLQHRRGHKGL